MIKALNSKDELVNVRATDKGELMVSGSGSGGGSLSSNEITLLANILTIDTEVSNISINKKVTSIDVANYSDSANVTLTIGNLNAVIGSSVATSLPINQLIDAISIVSSEDNTKVQLIVKVAVSN